MRLFRNRKRRLLDATIPALFVLMTLAGSSVNSGTTNAYQERSPTDNFNGESLPALRDVVRLSWDNLPTSDAVSVGSAIQVTLRVWALTSEPMRVEIFRLTADNGRQQTVTQILNDINLNPSASQAISVDLRKFGLELKGMKYSGRVQATARAFLRGEANYRQTDSPALYFHPANASASLLTFYGEQALKDQSKRFQRSDQSRRDRTGRGDNFAGDLRRQRQHGHQKL